jgi:hypothetical protein
MRETHFKLWGIRLLPLNLSSFSLDSVRDWAKKENLIREEQLVSEKALVELRMLFHMKGVGVLVHLYRDLDGRLCYKESPLVYVNALIDWGREVEISRFQLRLSKRDPGTKRVFFDFRCPRVSNLKISSLSYGKRVPDKFLAVYERLERCGYDTKRYLDESKYLQNIILEEVFEVEVFGDVSARFFRSWESRRIHDVDLRLLPKWIPMEKIIGFYVKLRRSGYYPSGVFQGQDIL